MRHFIRLAYSAKAVSRQILHIHPHSYLDPGAEIPTQTETARLEPKMLSNRKDVCSCRTDVVVALRRAQIGVRVQGLGLRMLR